MKGCVYLTFHERLKKERKKKKLTMEQLARKIGVAKSTYASYELNYREPSIATIQSISRVLNISADYLIGLTNHPNTVPLETNAKLYLQSRTLHWDGIKLEEEELNSIRDFLEFSVRNRVANKSSNRRESFL